MSSNKKSISTSGTKSRRKTSRVLAEMAADSRPAKKAKSSSSTWAKGKLSATVVEPDTFVVENHYYPRTLNAQLHPMVKTFMSLSNQRIAMRYCHLHPTTDYDKLLAILQTQPKNFRWAGADLFNVTNHEGKREMIVIETNSCPSGQKSLPFDSDKPQESGYHQLMSKTFMRVVREREQAGILVEGGCLAVVYDKNPMEATGYAAALADVSGEPVKLVEYYERDPEPPVRFTGAGSDVVMEVRDVDGVWTPVRAAFRYVTQCPWSRLPVDTKTFILNPVLACLAGGRNKMMADKAYELVNADLAAAGLQIRVPHTIRDVAKSAVPMWVASMGGRACVKNPYSNAGQGVWTLTSDAELAAFMDNTDITERYDKYIVQSLVGNASWSSTTRHGTFYHTGTIPNAKNEIYVADIRMMVHATASGFSPLSIYARKAREPLPKDVSGHDSWASLGTNLSVRLDDGSFRSQSERLLLMDHKDFNTLGVGMDDLVDGYIQTVLAVLAIDRLSVTLQCPQTGRFDIAMFATINDDPAFVDEIVVPAGGFLKLGDVQ